MTKITRRDLELVVLLAGLTPIALLAPPSVWPRICRRLAEAAEPIAPGRRREIVQRMPAYLPELSGLEPRQIVTRLIAHSYEENLATLRERLPGGWHPRLAVIGREHVDKALASGGAILWVAEFEFSSLVTKKALAGAGYRTVHLARPGHGFSTSPFSVRLLNPIQTRVEDRYLKARILIDEDDTIGGLRELRRRLEAGDLISITVGSQAIKAKNLPLFDCTLTLPTGPVTLAQAAGRPLMPVFTVRTQSGFEVHIEPPLELSSGDDLAPYLQYTKLMESYLKRWPLAWRGWNANA